MGRYIGPKGRLVRKFGVNIFGSPKFDKLLARKPYGPGAHGGKGGKFSRLSEFGVQLKAKRIAKLTYEVSEKQMKKYYEVASKSPASTFQIFFEELETRFDNIVFRLGFGVTRAQARQFVNHGFFLLNGKKAKTPSIKLKIGDIVSASPKAKKSVIIQENIKSTPQNTISEWLSLDKGTMTGKVLGAPSLEKEGQALNLALVTEFYSK